MRSPEVEIAVAQSQIVGGVFVFQMKRRSLGGVEDFDTGGEDLYFAGRQILVDLVAARTDLAVDADDVFAPDVLGDFIGFGSGGRIEDDLRYALPVPEIHEYKVSQGSAASYPAAKRNILSLVGAPQGVAGMCSFHLTSLMIIDFYPNGCRGKAAWPKPRRPPEFPVFGVLLSVFLFPK